MIYLCGWRSKRSQGSIEVDTRTARDTRTQAKVEEGGLYYLRRGDIVLR